MVDCMLEERIRDSVKDGLRRVIASNSELSRFSSVEVKPDPRISGHSRVFHAVASDPKHKQCRQLAVKNYHHPDVPETESGEDIDLGFVRAHDPGSLLVTESKNYEWLSKKVTMVDRNGSEKPTFLVPRYYGSDPLSSILVTRFMLGDVLQKKLHDASESDFSKIFLQGLKDVARLNGLSNAEENLKDYVIDPDEIRVKNAIFSSREREVLRANLARISYTLSKGLGENVPFSVRAVDRNLKVTGHSLDYLTGDIQEKLRAINEPVDIMHHDNNARNIIVSAESDYENRFIDLESLGPGPRMTDIASYCIVLSRGNNYVLSGDELFNYLNTYLVYESAWRERDPEKVDRLNGITDPKSFNAELQMTDSEYVTVASEFFLRAILKTMKLAGSAAREMQSATDRERAVVNPSESWIGDMNGLYEMVHQAITPSIGISEKAPELMAAFYAIGNAANKVGYQIDTNLLNSIGSGNHPGARFLGSMPSSSNLNGGKKA